jgi:hypothetical protein
MKYKIFSTQENHENNCHKKLHIGASQEKISCLIA